MQLIKEFEYIGKIEKRNNELKKRTNEMVSKTYPPPPYNDSVMRDEVVVKSAPIVIEKSYNQFVVDRLKTLRKKLKKDIKNTN